MECAAREATAQQRNHARPLNKPKTSSNLQVKRERRKILFRSLFPLHRTIIWLSNHAHLPKEQFREGLQIGRLPLVQITARPQLHLHTSLSPICAGIVERVALLSKEGWDAFSKTPTASKPVDFFRVQLHLEPEPTRNRCADRPTAKGLPTACRGRSS